MDCGSFLAVHANLIVRMGFFVEVDVDIMLANTITVQMRLGMFGRKPSAQHYRNLGPRDVCTLAHKQLVFDIVRQGIVLLKNYGFSLPFSTSPHCTIAVIGSNFDVTITMIKNYVGNSSLSSTFFPFFSFFRVNLFLQC